VVVLAVLGLVLALAVIEEVFHVDAASALGAALAVIFMGASFAGAAYGIYQLFDGRTESADAGSTTTPEHPDQYDCFPYAPGPC
jgi:threonine/homoserine efflux transporter RhtA